jgi:hypothetical protein
VQSVTDSIFARSTHFHRLVLLGLVLACAASVFAADRETERTERFLDVHGLKLAPVILAKKAQESVLVARIEGRITPRMPPGPPLSPEQIQTVRKWIDAGALKDAYLKDVLPIFAARCNGCHGAASAGKLRMDTFEFLKERIAPAPAQ